MKQCMSSLAVPSGAPATARYSGKWTCNVSGDRSGSASFIFMPGDHGTIEASSNVFLSGEGSATFTLVFQRRAASLYATLDATAWLARFVDKSTIKIDERSATDGGECVKLVYACTPK
jgi:hypothetical protein